MRKPLWRPVPLVAAAVVGLAATMFALPSGSSGRAATAASRWVDTWTAMPRLTEPANMPPAPFAQPNLVLANSTDREMVQVSTGGRQLRLQLSNAFGGTDLPVTVVSVTLPADGKAGASAIRPDTTRTVTFAGQPRSRSLTGQWPSPTPSTCRRRRRPSSRPGTQHAGPTTDRRPVGGLAGLVGEHAADHVLLAGPSLATSGIATA